MRHFSHAQQMLALCYIAYYGYALRGNDRKNETAIAAQIDHALGQWKPIQGQWQRVWGPAVFALPGTEFDDSMAYVVQHQEQTDKYCVVIRGTNPISIPNWVIWDFQAKDLKLWPGFKGDLGDQDQHTLPCLSESSYFGLTIVQSLRPSLGVLGCNQTLLEFFQAKAETGANLNITTTGHSLGGALSPLVALWLKQQSQQLPNCQFDTVTFAAPTPGNKVFAQYFHQHMGDSCVRVGNDLDIVTLAWEEALMKNMFGLYLFKLPPLLPTPPLLWMLDTLRKQAKGKNYSHLSDRSAVFPGQYNSLALPYVTQAIYQHVFAYPELLEMEDDIPIDSWLPLSAKLSKDLRKVRISP